MNGNKGRVVVVGGGISGISCAYRLSATHDVTLLEKNDYLGGHTNTLTIDSGPDEGLRIDTGFIVLNDKNYPLFHRFLAELGVPVRWSDMSFGFWCERTGFCYAGTNLNGLFADRKNLCSPRFFRLLAGIARFARKGAEALRSGTLGTKTLDEFLSEANIGPEAVSDYILPMGAAIWSAPSALIRTFPAAAYLRFFENHGLLGLRDRPKWQTVVGGSRSYVEAFRARFRGVVKLNARVATVLRDPTGVTVHCEDGTVERYDLAVFASHADETLRMLADPSELERELLGPWRYQVNRTVLHHDRSVLPPNRRAWASWNYTREASAADDEPVSVSYAMNRLQGLRSEREYCVSLNRQAPIAESKIIREILYTHPVYSTESIATQSKLSSLQGLGNSYFCGSYFGYGFHEDGIRSGEAAALAVQRSGVCPQ